MEGADAVAHGATGKGNDQVRFELTVMALNPKLKIIAPWREWHIRSREDALKYAAEHNVPVTATHQVDLQPRPQPLAPEPRGRRAGRSVERARRRTCSSSPTARRARRTRPEYVEIYFEQGMPKRVNGEAMGPVDLVATLNAMGGKHGVGRIDIVENRLVGMKSRGVYETPGGTILYRAHEGLEQICLDKQTLQYKQMLALKYAELVYNGQWFTPAARGAGRLRRRDAEARDRHVAAQAVQGQRQPGRAASRPTACTARTTPPSARRTSTTRRTPRASSSCSACR